MKQQTLSEEWPPLESNPDIINRLCSTLGLRSEKFTMHEIFSIEEWALSLIPRPVVGILMLFDESQPQQKFKEAESHSLDPSTVPSSVFFMKQYAENACGTIALFHIILNMISSLPLLITADSIFERFSKSTETLSPEERGHIFQSRKEIQVEHKRAVEEGETQILERPSAHFIAFISKEGRLYELDGCKKCPVDHGECSPHQLLEKSVLKIQQFMNRDPQNTQFSLMALAPASSE